MEREHHARIGRGPSGNQRGLVRRRRLLQMGREASPTEAEWEKAAKGPNDWRFPWGDVEPTDKHLNYNQVTWRGETTLVPVGIYEAGKSPYGAYDMAGNVWGMGS